ncbi:hypothetical protein DF185_19760 [Marinifilum breve]|uniref:Uncharacterized protein n=1 Tax=Marinifilum breve TaxID=2184082 RepID=A0A2V3ZSP4_9BACT|nr:hypothetical protein [Marinifilum breve]PXX96878.1 hypothetical protein DF185_19760 [Marinifilum breve]
MFDKAVNKRVKLFLENKEISQEQFKKDISVKSKQQVSNWINCNEKIPERHLFTMIHIYKDLNARWLITGEGEMNEPEGKDIVIHDGQTIFADNVGQYGGKGNVIGKQAPAEDSSLKKMVELKDMEIDLLKKTIEQKDKMIEKLLDK